MYLKIQEYINSKPILYGQTSTRTPFGVNIREVDYLPNLQSKKLVPEGMFIVQVGDVARFLPRAKVKNAVATNSPTVTLKSPCMTFKVGDVLHAVAGYAEVTFGGTIAQNDIFTLKIGGSNYSVIAGATPTGATVAAGFVTAHAADLLALGVTVTQKGSTATVLIRATDAHPIATQTSSGASTIMVSTTEPGYLGDCILPLGTIQSIGAVNAAGERAVTLVANAAYALPANVSVGTAVDKYLGIYPFNLDLTEQPVHHFAPICEADGVYEQNLPYCDMQLKREFRDLRINTRFYTNS